jgi:hypothetical protein
MLSLLMTSVAGPQCALWPSGWLAENETRLAVSENAATNQCVGWLSAAHPVLGKTTPRISCALDLQGHILKIRPRRSKLAREYLQLSAMQKPNPAV